MKTTTAKIYPNKTQEKALLSLLENARLMYNVVLAEKIRVYQEDGVNLSGYDLQKLFKGDFGIPIELKDSICMRVDASFKSFFKKLCGYPRFKAKNRYRSMVLKDFSKNRTFRIVDGKLRVWPTFGVGTMRLRGLQPYEGAKSGRIVKRASGWYLQMIVPTQDKKPVKRVKTVVGIDMGIRSFSTDSAGFKTASPKFLQKVQKGKQTSGREHERVENRRRDFLHKLSRKYASNHLVVVEKLETEKMGRDKRFSNDIHDAGWATFHRMLSYKLKTLGHYFVQVDPAYTSQTCSACGKNVKKALSVRVHKCSCGYTADRDVNAARNIAQLGRATASSLGIGVAVTSL